jgi:hypothetical protein
LKHPYHRKKGRCKGANPPEALGTEIQAIAFLRTTTCPACVNFFVDLKNGPRSEIERAIALGWLWQHESGTYVKFTDSGR